MNQSCLCVGNEDAPTDSLIFLFRMLNRKMTSRKPSKYQEIDTRVTLILLTFLSYWMSREPSRCQWRTRTRKDLKLIPKGFVTFSRPKVRWRIASFVQLNSHLYTIARILQMLQNRRWLAACLILKNISACSQPPLWDSYIYIHAYTFLTSHSYDIQALLTENLTIAILTSRAALKQ